MGCMKMVARPLLFVLLLLISGCFTAKECHRTRDGPTFPDRVDCVEKAFISKSDQLLVFVKARLADAVKPEQYTLIIPLSEAESCNDTNQRTPYGELYLSRNAIRDGWMAGEVTKANFKSVMIGSRVDWYSPGGRPGNDDEYKNFYALKEQLEATPGKNCALYQIGTSDGTTSWRPMEFVYVDTTQPEAFTFVSIERETSHTRIWMLPLTVTGDLVTLPFQIIGMIAGTISYPLWN
jgi:hypothetical protein